jgi:hypothetical protein
MAGGPTAAAGPYPLHLHQLQHGFAMHHQQKEECDDDLDVGGGGGHHPEHSALHRQGVAGGGGGGGGGGLFPPPPMATSSMEFSPGARDDQDGDSGKKKTANLINFLDIFF